MPRIVIGGLAALLLLTGCRSARVETVDSPIPGGATEPVTTASVPAGTQLEVHLDQTLSTRDTRRGDPFTATLEQPVRTAGGTVVIPQGAVVHGEVTGVDTSDHIGEQAAIRLNFDRITFSGRSYPFAAAVVRTEVEVDDRVRTRDVAREAAIGAAAGAALGAVLSGDLEQILTGAILGAAAGTIISLGTGDVEAALPAGTDLTLQTTRNIALR